MKGWAVALLVAVSSVCIAQAAFGINVWDNQTYGFGLGIKTNMTNISGPAPSGLTLAVESGSDYFMKGSFISRTFDAGQFANWSSFAVNASVNSSEHSYSVLCSVSNNSQTWTAFSGLSPNGLMGRYLNYSVNLSTTNNQTRPVVDLVNLTYGFVPPTPLPVSPSDGNVSEISSFILNCSATSVTALKNISVFWNGTGTWAANYTYPATGFYNYSNVSVAGLPAGMYKWACLAYDEQHNPGWGVNRTLSYVPDVQGPSLFYNITPVLVMEGGYFVVSAYAVDSSLHSVWMNMTYPNGTNIRVGMANGGFVNITQAPKGAYGILVFANDSSGNTTNASASFSVVAPILVNFSVSATAGIINSNVTLYQANTSSQIAFFGATNGSYTAGTVPNATYDMGVSAYDGRLWLNLSGVEVSSNVNKRLVIDSPSVSGMVRVFAINSSYAMSSARLRIYYTGVNVSNEASMRVQRCADWNFNLSLCSGSWADINSTVNTASDYVESDISSFSAYAARQGAYCGDGACGANEGPGNCTADCSCVNGQSRNCSATHSGRCAAGSEVCANGAWAGCPAPAAETCNQVDDNCDGTVDNVGNGTSSADAKCQCYGGGLPVSEACDGIDNNCNGQTDENLQRQCGSNIGTCRYGTSACADGAWDNCTGGVQPVSEICTNNDDDNCNGQVNEGCASNAACGLGEIPEAGCRCGNMTYTGGFCCGGIFQNESCFRMPWEIFIIVGVAAGLAGFFIHKTRKKNKDDEWSKLEKKYTAAPPNYG
jgi:hypothetical protein